MTVEEIARKHGVPKNHSVAWVIDIDPTLEYKGITITSSTLLSPEEINIIENTLNGE